MATFSTAISASSDDAQEAAGTMTINGGGLNANAANAYIGLRFLNVTIPPGSTINTASVDVYFISGSFDDPDVTIYAEDTDDAATFTTAASNISGRTPTTATASWDAGSVGTGWKTSPDFAPVIQEIIDRGGWVSGNAIAPIFKGDDAGTLMRINSIDLGTGTEPVLNIDYTPPGGGVTLKTMYYARMRA